jgi:Flp pilus assembly protein TadG
MRRLGGHLKRFWVSRNGSGSVFNLVMLPVFLALAGLAIDAAMVYRTKAALQIAADAAALAAARDVPAKASNAATDAIAFAHLNLPPSSNGEVLMAADVELGNWDSDTGVFTVGGSPQNAARVTTRRAVANNNPHLTTFLRLIGLTHWDVSAVSVATSERPKLWIGLALDNTGSMCEPYSNPCPGSTTTDPDHPGPSVIKINALKMAAVQLLDLLKNAQVNDGDIELALIPFARDVNVGTANAAASWLQFVDFQAAATPIPSASKGPGSSSSNTSCPWTKTSNGFQCQTSPVNDANSYNATAPRIPTSGSYKGYICPSLDSHGHFYNGCYDSTTLTSDKSGNPTSWSHLWRANAIGTWTGCVTDRPQNNDVLVTAPIAGSLATLFPADNTPSCPTAAIMNLTGDWTALKSQVYTMQAAGSTNQTIGLVWAWQALQQGAPMYAPALPPRTKRIIILLSDGLNTQNRWDGGGSSHDTAVDARTRAVCDNIKAQGIEIYTVFDDLDGTQGNSDVLAYCASGSDHYYDLTTAGAMISTFVQIGQRITALRIVE